jgi:hypothetical protein
MGFHLLLVEDNAEKVGFGIKSRGYSHHAINMCSYVDIGFSWF